MASTRGAFAQLLAPGLKIKTFQWLKEHPPEYPDYLVVETSDSAYDEEQVMTSFGQATEFAEGEPVVYDDPVQGATKRWTHKKYGIAWLVTEEMLDDDKYGIMKKQPSALGRSLRYTTETVAATVLNNGFGTSMTTADGLSLLNTAHALQSGGTYSNRANPAATLSVTSLQDALVNFEKIVDERGLKMHLSPDCLLIPPDEQFVATRILGSQFLPSTGNNDINPVQGRLEVIVVHFATDTNNWFVLSKEANEAKLKWRRKPKLESADDFDTGAAKFKMTMRFSVAVSDWRAWYGSNP